MSDKPTEERNKNLMSRWFDEVWNQGRAELIDEYRALDAVASGLGDAESSGKTPFENFYANLRTALPDLRVRIDDMIAEGDKVVTRITAEGSHEGEAMGIAPTRKTVRFTGIVIARIAGGKIAEAWNSLDQLSLLRQIGALPEGAPHGNFLITRD